MTEDFEPVSDSGSGGLELLVIQPTPFCNLDCDYCYLPDRGNKARIQPAVLRAIFQRVFDSNLVGPSGFTTVWHAGEPLVLPISFYREAIKVITEENTSGYEVRQSIQTNGTLLSPEWCEFLKEEQVSLGVSIDGPSFLNDQHRKTRSGKGTWEKTARGIQLLKEHEVPFHVISVLTAESLDFPDELFDFYLEHGINDICFNVEEVEGPNTESSLIGPGIEEKYRRFLSRFFDLVNQSEARYSVREFDSALGAVLSERDPRSENPQMTTPFAAISIDHAGNFSSFSPELLGLEYEGYEGFSFGNVLTDQLGEAHANQNFERISREIAAGVERCRETCDYFNQCGGGCPVNKLFENGTFDSTETMFCRLSRQVPIDLILEKIESGIPTSETVNA